MYKLFTNLWMLRCPEDDGGQGGEPVQPKLEDSEAFKSLKSEVESLKKDLSDSKEENKKLSSELTNVKQELQDTRDAYKEMFGDKGNNSDNDKGDKKAPSSINLLDEVAKCELK